MSLKQNLSHIWKRLLGYLGLGGLRVKTGSVHRCEECNTEFWVTSLESRVLLEKDLGFPKRCRMCLKYGKSSRLEAEQLPRVVSRR